MAETFFTLADGSPRAVMGIRRKSDGTVQTLDQSVPDGDTVGLQLDGTGSVRFLGIDSPEKSFEHQGAAGAGRIAAAWQRCAAAARPVWDVTGRRSRSDDGPGRRSPPQGVPGSVDRAARRLGASEAHANWGVCSLWVLYAS